MESLSWTACQEMEKLIPAHVKKIREILEEEYKIVIPDQCDEFIARCLRTKDGNIENAIKLIRAFQAAVINFRQWDAVIRPTVGEEIQRAGIAIPMKNRDASGRFVIILRIGMWDPKITNFDQGIAFLWMITQYISTQFRDIQTHGFVTVFDLSGFTMQHAWAVRQWRLLSLGKWAQNGVAGRLKALHAIHHPKIVDLIYKGIKPFLKEKLKKRINLHDSTESLVRHVGAQNLPEYLGGIINDNECVDEPLVEGFFNSDQYFQDMMEVGFPCK